MIAQFKVCIKYLIFLYWNNNKENKSNNTQIIIVLKTLLQAFLYAFIGWFIFSFIFSKVSNLKIIEEIFILHVYTFAIFFINSFSIHLNVFPQLKDNIFFASKPIKKNVRSLSLLFFTLYIFGITMFPTILTISILGGIRWSTIQGVVLFCSLILVTIIGICISAIIFLFLKSIFNEDFFLAILSIIKSFLNILMLVSLTLSQYYKGGINHIFYFLPALSNLIFFVSSNYITIPYIVSFITPIFFLILYIYLVNYALHKIDKKKVRKRVDSNFPTLTNSKKQDIVKALYIRIMNDDKVYKRFIYKNIGNLFSLPFLIVIYNIKFSSSQNLITERGYFIAILWCFIFFAVYFTQAYNSEYPKANWLVTLLEKKQYQNKKIFNSINLSRLLVFGVLPLASLSIFFTISYLNFIYTFFILVLTFLNIYFMILNSSDNTVSPFSCAKEYNIKSNSIDGLFVFIFTPLIYYFYFLRQSIKLVYIILPVFLLFSLIFVFIRSIYYDDMSKLIYKTFFRNAQT